MKEHKQKIINVNEHKAESSWMSVIAKSTTCTSLSKFKLAIMSYCNLIIARELGGTKVHLKKT